MVQILGGATLVKRTMSCHQTRSCGDERISSEKSMAAAPVSKVCRDRLLMVRYLVVDVTAAAAPKLPKLYMRQGEMIDVFKRDQDHLDRILRDTLYDMQARAVNELSLALFVTNVCTRSCRSWKLACLQ